MFVALRILSLILIVIALMLLGADFVTTLEKGGEITVRSLDDVWAMFDKAAVEGFKSWLEHTLPGPTSGWAEAILSLPGWAFFGVLGVILAFLFGRRHGEID
jgi:hypothetical protein